MTASLGRTGIYLRLSRDDERAGESVSIENQRAILRKFVAEQGGAVAGEYVDDGWSGTDFERPGVTRLLEDAKAGKLDTVVVKDLSRFGRNYIRVGQYIDYIFPAYGIRFIALNDRVDTADRASAAMDMMPIMNVFNEWHAANTSRKIRAVLETNWRQGRYTNWAYPYGYKAGTDEKRTAVIDEDAARVVRRIYDMRLQGGSLQAIARRLTDEGIPNPATYFTRLDGRKSERRCSPHWSPKTVRDILRDPTYLGTLTQHKTTRFSYKNHRVVSVPEGERVVKEHAHAAIISRAVWDRVQEMNGSALRGRADMAKTVHPLSGLLVCADCGRKMKRRTSKGKKRPLRLPHLRRPRQAVLYVPQHRRTADRRDRAERHPFHARDSRDRQGSRQERLPAYAGAARHAKRAFRRAGTARVQGETCPAGRADRFGV